MLFKECFKIHIIEYRANQGNVFPKKSSYCKDHAIQGFVNQGPTVFANNLNISTYGWILLNIEMMLKILHYLTKVSMLLSNVRFSTSF